MRAVVILIRSCSLALRVAVALAVALGVARAQTIDFGRYHALVIGNDDYTHLPTLKNAVADAQAVERLLKDRYGFDTTLLLDATRDEIVRGLNDLRASLTTTDNLLIYYAGHGTLDGDVGFWQGVDAEPNYETNWIPNSDLTRNLRAMTAHHVMVVADSCYSGTLTRYAPATLPTGEERQAWVQRMAGQRSRTAMTSGDLEKVLDGGGRGHSIFARAFLDVLESNQDVLDGQALFDSIKGKIVLETVQTPQYSDIQFAEHGGGDFLFVPREVQMAVLVEQQSFGPQRDAGGDLGEDFQVWSLIQNSTNPIDLQTFIETFPDSVWVKFARNRLAEVDASRSPEETAALVKPEGAEQEQESLEPGAPDAAAEAELAALESARRTPQLGWRVQPAVGVYSRPGEFRDCAECPEMVVVPAGEFMMGSSPDEAGRDSDEEPQHRVRISRPFAVGKYEVTFAQWDACVADGGCDYTPDDEGWSRGDRPVINVSWSDAKEYLAWLSRKTQEGYRLLSEAEWEYVARAGSDTAYWWGPDIGRGKANCGGCGSQWDYKQTAPVGSFGANDFGLHDTAGNVSEWVEDCVNGSYDRASANGSPCLTGICLSRILRGGSWYGKPTNARSASRGGDALGYRSAFYGFRVARTID